MDNQASILLSPKMPAEFKEMQRRPGGQPSLEAGQVRPHDSLKIEGPTTRSPLKYILSLLLFINPTFTTSETFSTVDNLQ